MQLSNVICAVKRSLPILLVLCAGCQRPPEPTYFSGYAMGMAYSVQVGDPLTPKQEVEIELTILSTFTQINTVYNNWNPQSEISQLNALAAHERVELSAELTTFLSRIDHLVKLTEGRFDPTIQPLQQLWKKSLRENHLPEEEEVARLLPAVGWDKIHLEGSFFWKEHALSALDVGGIAKGLAVDLLAENLEAMGYTSVCVNWSGEVRTHGSHPALRPWKLAIERGPQIELNEEALATSGSYNQHWTIGGRTYTHIINPRTLEPLTEAPIESISVVAPTCAEADALATALMLFETPEEAQEWAEACEMVTAVFALSRDPSRASSPAR